MTDANPPKERDPKTIRPDDLHEWLIARLETLLETAERYRGLRRLSPPERGDRPISDDFIESARPTCCIGGRATRQIPCLNPKYWGCPFRDREFDFDVQRGLTRGRVRRHHL
jgi:hypothetical protein